MTEPSGFFSLLRRQQALVFTLCVAALLAGLLAISRLGSGIYPEVDFPRIVVVARAGDTPPELMEVPTNSVPTTGDFSSSLLTCKSFTQFEWMSPVRTIGLSDFRSAKNFRTRCRLAS